MSEPMSLEERIFEMMRQKKSKADIIRFIRSTLDIGLPDAIRVFDDAEGKMYKEFEAEMKGV